MLKHNNWSSNLNSVKNKFFDFKELVRNEIDISLVIEEEIETKSYIYRLRNQLYKVTFQQTF